MLHNGQTGFCCSIRLPFVFHSTTHRLSFFSYICYGDVWFLEETLHLFFYFLLTNRFFGDSYRYVAPGSGRSHYNFIIPLKGCGSGPARCGRGNCGSIENVIIIQTDNLVQVQVLTSCYHVSAQQVLIKIGKELTVIISWLGAWEVPGNSSQCWYGNWTV